MSLPIQKFLQNCNLHPLFLLYYFWDQLTGTISNFENVLVGIYEYKADLLFPFPFWWSLICLFGCYWALGPSSLMFLGNVYDNLEPVILYLLEIFFMFSLDILRPFCSLSVSNRYRLLAHTINCYLVILKKWSYFSIGVSIINLFIFKESRDSATIWMVAVLCLVSLVMRQATGFIYVVLWCDRMASLRCLGYSMGLTAIKDAAVMVRG